MNLADELAKTTKELIEINDKYNELFDRLFQELNKYFSFIDMRKLNLKDKTITYENYDKQLNTFKVALFFYSKYKLPTKSFCTIEIKSDFNNSFLKKIIAQFCIANKFNFKDLS